MSDKAPKNESAAPEAAGGAVKKSGGLLSKTPVLLGGVMVIEAILLFAGFKILGGSSPKPASGAEMAEHESHDGHDGGHAPVDKKKIVEIHVVDDFRAPNKVNGHTYFYEVSIVVLTKTEASEKVKPAIEERGALIKDRIRTIIAQSDPEKLGGGSEPGLETFRRQVKYQLDEIIGDGLIDEVLVPKCIPYRTDF
jgi:flagellar basal body-associated protein FliL